MLIVHKYCCNNLNENITTGVSTAICLTFLAKSMYSLRIIYDYAVSTFASNSFFSRVQVFAK